MIIDESLKDDTQRNEESNNVVKKLRLFKPQTNLNLEVNDVISPRSPGIFGPVLKAYRTPRQNDG